MNQNLCNLPCSVVGDEAYTIALSTLFQRQGRLIRAINARQVDLLQ